MAEPLPAGTRRVPAADSDLVDVAHAPNFADGKTSFAGPFSDGPAFWALMNPIHPPYARKSRENPTIPGFTSVPIFQELQQFGQRSRVSAASCCKTALEFGLAQTSHTPVKPAHGATRAASRFPRSGFCLVGGAS